MPDSSAWNLQRAIKNKNRYLLEMEFCANFAKIVFHFSLVTSFTNASSYCHIIYLQIVKLLKLIE